MAVVALRAPRKLKKSRVERDGERLWMKYGTLSVVVLIFAPLVGLAAFLIDANAPEGEGAPLVAIVLAAIIIAALFGFHWLNSKLSMWVGQKISRAHKLSQIRADEAERLSDRAAARGAESTQSHGPGDGK